jgi:hypothetical protein
MNRQKIEENVAKFLAAGFIRAGQQLNGYPLVYRKQELSNRIVCKDIYIVNEDISPDTLVEQGQ